MDTNQDRPAEVGGTTAIEPIDATLWPPRPAPIVVPTPLDDADWARLRLGGQEQPSLSDAAWNASTAPANPDGTSPGGSSPAGGRSSRRPRSVVLAAAGVGVLAVVVLAKVLGGGSAADAPSSAGTTVAPATASTVVTTVAAVAPSAPSVTVTTVLNDATTAPRAVSAPSTTAGPSALLPLLPDLASSSVADDLLGRRPNPLTWWGEVVGGRIVVRGRIASPAERATVLANAVAKVGADHVVDELVVDSSVPGTAFTDGPVPVFVETPLLFGPGSSALPAGDPMANSLLGFARYTLFTQPSVRLAAVGWADGTEPAGVAVERARAVVGAVSGGPVDAARVTALAGHASGGNALAADRRVELVFFGLFDA